MERRIPFWMVALMLLLAIAFAVVLAWAVRHHLVAPRSSLGRLGNAAEFIATLPVLPRDIYLEILGPSPQLVEDRFPNQASGLTYLGGQKDDGYLLLSVFDGKANQSVVKLIRLSDGEELHRWKPDVYEIRNRTRDQSRFSERNNIWPKRYRITHPFLLEDGSLVFNTPLISISACSKINWILDDVFYHHSIQRDHEGNFWVPSVMEPGLFGEFASYGAKFRDDALSKVSPEGRVLFQKSVAEILIENGYRDLLWAGSYSNGDVTHLNDIEPAHTDSAFWKKGDLLISLRKRNAVFLYRPATNKVLWLKVGPWVGQHDADFVGDSSISVFGNNYFPIETPDGNNFSSPSNEVYLVDLGTGVTTSPFRDMLQRQEVRTRNEGLSEVLLNGNVFVEETNYGRLLKGSKQGVQWSYIERVKTGYLAMPAWSRHLSADYVNPILPKLKCK